MDIDILNLNLPSNKLRLNVLRMAKNGNSVHIGCAFSLIEILAVLYEKFIRFDLKNVQNPMRDLLCLSKGHGVMAVYSCLYELGLIPDEAIEKYFADGSPLKGLSDSQVSSIEVSGGTLGHGITVATGNALAIKLKKQNRNVFCIVGDGEMNEGSVWESLLFAAHWKLSNFILIIDANGQQAMGRVNEVLNCEPFFSKLDAFNFQTWECDGHSRDELTKVFAEATKTEDQRPKAIIARTVKGKGVSFMEDNNIWHYTRLNDDTYNSAVSELGISA